MALSIKNADSRSEDVWGRQKVRTVEVTFDSSYDAGGESLTAASVGLAEILFVDASPDANALPGHIVAYNYSTKKLQVFRVGTHTHTENTAAAYTQNATTAANSAAALAEVTAATDLSTLKVRVLVVGR